MALRDLALAIEHKLSNHVISTTTLRAMICDGESVRRSDCPFVLHRTRS